MAPRLWPSVDWTVSESDTGGVGVRLGEQSASAGRAAAPRRESRCW